MTHDPCKMTPAQLGDLAKKLQTLAGFADGMAMLCGVEPVIDLTSGPMICFPLFAPSIADLPLTATICPDMQAARVVHAIVPDADDCPAPAPAPDPAPEMAPASEPDLMREVDDPVRALDDPVQSEPPVVQHSLGQVWTEADEKVVLSAVFHAPDAPMQIIANGVAPSIGRTPKAVVLRMQGKLAARVSQARFEARQARRKAEAAKIVPAPVPVREAVRETPLLGDTPPREQKPSRITQMRANSEALAKAARS